MTCMEGYGGGTWSWNDFAIIQSGPSMVKWNLSGGWW
jgi:hypothetical protein